MSDRTTRSGRPRRLLEMTESEIARAVRLHVDHEMSFAQLARRFGCSSNQVSQAVRQALAAASSSQSTTR